MHIRDIPIDPPLILAPMEGVTEVIFRRAIRRIGGCGMTVTEFVSAKGLRQRTRRELRLVQIDPGEHPITVQVFGRDPIAMAEGAQVAVELGADIVDINMGCPSKRVCQRSGGSALMKEPALAREIVSSVRAGIEVPLTVKMRSGWDHEHRNAPEIAWMCQEEGAEAVTVHWRTRADLYGGVRELDTIATIKDRLSIPVVANGDIVDGPSALETLRYTACDGLMIGRGAIRNPWVFREVAAALAGRPAPVVSHAEREAVLLRFYEEIRAGFSSENGALGRMKMIAKYFTGALPDGAVLRTQILHSQSADEVEKRVRTFFAALDDTPVTAGTASTAPPG